MAHIPFGYRIERGQAVIDQEAAGKIECFVKAYLGGQSVKEANEKAQIPLCEASLRNLLKSRTYLGTDYYPVMTTAAMFQRVQEERERRTHPASIRAAEPISEKKTFRFEPEISSCPTCPSFAGKGHRRGAAGIVECLYRQIRPSSDGRKTAASSEVEEMKRIIGLTCVSEDQGLIGAETQKADRRRDTES